MHVSIRRAFMTASVALAWTSVTFFTTSASAQSPAATTSVQATSAAAPQTNTERYRDGIVIWETPEDAKVPFLLKFNINTQLRYLNTQNSDETFTDHLGVTREVNKRNDITVNRAMFILGGYIFDQRARYSFTVWTSAGAASIVDCQQHRLANSTRPSRLWQVTLAFQAVDHWSTRSRSLRQPTGPWRTTSSAPGSRREPGQAENR